MSAGNRLLIEMSDVKPGGETMEDCRISACQRLLRLIPAMQKFRIRCQSLIFQKILEIWSLSKMS